MWLGSANFPPPRLTGWREHHKFTGLVANQKKKKLLQVFLIKTEERIHPERERTVCFYLNGSLASWWRQRAAAQSPPHRNDPQRFSTKLWTSGRFKQELLRPGSLEKQ